MSQIKSVGIDVSKNKLDICLYKEENSIFTQVGNNPTKINDLTALLDNHQVGLDTPIIIESTGGYQLLAVQVLQQNNFSVKLINPLITQRYLHTHIRKVKTDKKDSLILAQIGLQEKLFIYEESPESIEFKRLYRLRVSFIKQRQIHRNQVTHILDTFQEKESSLELSILKETIKYLDIQIKKLDKEILSKETIKDTIEQIGKIPGISNIALAGIIIELGDVMRFKGKKQVVAFAGLDPSIKESGLSVRGRSKISKRGSKTLRSILCRCSWGVFMHNKELKLYFEKKRSEGKHYFTALVATARKILIIIYSLLKSGQKYRLGLDCGI
jgi:transposase